MHHRHYLVAASLTVHFAAVLGLFVAGFWKLDRLDAPRRTIDLAVGPPQPAAASGSPAPAPAEPFKKKKPERVVTKELTQPEPKPPETAPAQTEAPASDGGGGTGTGPGSGSGSSPDTDGECTGEDCGPGGDGEKREAEPKIPPKPTFVPPAVIKGLRTSGETQIQMSGVEKTALVRSGTPRASATVKVCVGERGNVVSLAFAKRSGYAGWDAAILAAMRAWRYKPHRIGQRAVTVCGMVTFLYEIR